MSNIEPTEEQLQKGEQMYASSDYMTSRDFAEILAEREAKLREGSKVGSDWWHQAAIEAQDERDTLRARVAELEAERGDTVGCEGCGKRLPYECAIPTEDPVYLCARCVSPMHMEREAQHLARIAELETVYESYREARARIAQLEDANGLDEVAHFARISELYRDNEQHLADIKALRTALASVCIDILTSPAVTDTMWSHRSGLSTTNDYIASVLGIDTVDAYGKPTAELVRLANHDAKADAPAVCRPDDNACGYCSMCKASTEGGAR